MKENLDFYVLKYQIEFVLSWLNNKISFESSRSSNYRLCHKMKIYKSDRISYLLHGHTIFCWLSSVTELYIRHVSSACVNFHAPRKAFWDVLASVVDHIFCYKKHRENTVRNSKNSFLKELTLSSTILGQNWQTEEWILL